MGRRSKVATLPEDVRRELEQRLIGGGFSDYSGLAEWLAGQGYEISRAAVHSYGQKMERRVEQIRLATEHAEALVEASGDTAALADASMRVIQERMWDVLIASDEGDVKTLSAAARALADTARASVTIQQERRKVLQKAADKVTRVVREAGAPADLEAALRKILFTGDDA